MSEVMTPEQVAEVMQVNVRMVRYLWATGQLGGVKVGRHVRHRRSDVDAYLAARAVAPKAVAK